jgi:endonuclease G
MLTLILSLLILSCSPVGTQRVVSDVVDGLELPAYGEDEDIVVHLGYTASYNHLTLCPDWVAWELTAAEADGDSNGNYSFSRDPDVSDPKACREDYRNSGYDKGHMAPRADMKWNKKALEESYYFTNVCPQNHQMNSQAWRKIEELSRRLARHYGSVYIVCGPLYGEHRFGTIGKNGLQVPDGFFKALAVSTDQGVKTVAFLMENTPQNGSPKRYAVSVDSVESLLGRNLFPLVDEAAESSFDWEDWNIKK